MNITVVEKLEKGFIKVDWSTQLNRIQLSQKILSEFVDKLDNWKSNKKCKEIILIKYKSIPIYVTIKRANFKQMGVWLMDRLKKLEMYEDCARLHNIWNKL